MPMMTEIRTTATASASPTVDMTVTLMRSNDDSHTAEPNNARPSPEPNPNGWKSTSTPEHENTSTQKEAVFLCPEILTRILKLACGSFESVTLPRTPIVNRVHYPEDTYDDPEDYAASSCTLCPQLNLYNWCLVNKFWNAMATPMLYKEINLNLSAIPGRTVHRPVYTDYGGGTPSGLVWAEPTESKLVGKRDVNLKWKCSFSNATHSALCLTTRPKDSPDTIWFEGKWGKVTNGNEVTLEVRQNHCCAYARKRFFDPHGVRKRKFSWGYCCQWEEKESVHTQNADASIRPPKDCTFAHRQHHNFYHDMHGSYRLYLSSELWYRVGPFNPVTAYLFDRVLVPLMRTLKARQDLANMVKKLQLPSIIYQMENYMETVNCKLDAHGHLHAAGHSSLGGQDMLALLLKLLREMVGLCTGLERLDAFPEINLHSALNYLKFEDKNLKSVVAHGARGVYLAVLLSKPLRWDLTYHFYSICSLESEREYRDSKRLRQQRKSAWKELLLAVLPKLRSWRIGGYPPSSAYVEPSTKNLHTEPHLSRVLCLDAGSNLVHLALVDGEPRNSLAVKKFFSDVLDDNGSGLPHWNSLLVEDSFVSVLEGIPGNKLRILQVRKWKTLEPVLDYIKRSYAVTVGTDSGGKSDHMPSLPAPQPRLESLTIDIAPREFTEQTWMYGDAAPMVTGNFLGLQHIYTVLRFAPSLRELVIRRSRYAKDEHWKMKTEEKYLALDWPSFPPSIYNYPSLVAPLPEPLDPPSDLRPGEPWPPVATNLKSLAILSWGAPLRSWLLDVLKAGQFPNLRSVDYIPATAQLNRNLFFLDVHRDECKFYEYLERSPPSTSVCVSCGFSDPVCPRDEQLAQWKRCAELEHMAIVEAGRKKGVKVETDAGAEMLGWGISLPCRMSVSGQGRASPGCGRVKGRMSMRGCTQETMRHFEA